MKRFLVFLSLAFAVLPLHARAESPDAGWAKVVQLMPGTAIHIKTATNVVKCHFTSASTDAIVCSNPNAITVQRADIQSITLPHRGRSAAVGLAIGAGGGAVAGAAAGESGQIIGRGGLAAIFAVPLGVIGALVGLSTDFTHSTIYRSH